MTVRTEQLVVDALRDWLRLKLPAQVATVNASRKAVLKTPAAGPFEVGSNKVLRLSTQRRDGSFTEVPLTAGTRTAAELAADIEAVLPNVAEADDEGRLVLTSTTVPEGITASLMCVGPDNGTGINGALGFDAGGEYQRNAPLVAPGVRGVADGFPTQPDMGRGFWVIVGDRRVRPIEPQPRRDESICQVELAIFHPATANEMHRNRNAIQAALQCVREVLMTSEGRQLGRAATGDIVLVQLGEAHVSGIALQVRLSGEAPNVLMDVASQKLLVKVFERPTGG